MNKLLAKISEWIAPRHSLTPKVLLLASSGAKPDQLMKGCEAAGVLLVVTESWERATAMLMAAPIPVVLYDVARSDRGWREAVAVLENARAKPSVILLTEWTERYGAHEADDWGGYDTLGPPFYERRVEAAVRIARIVWKNQTELRGALAARHGSATRSRVIG